MSAAGTDLVIDKFKSLISKWSGVYKWVEVSYLAVKTDGALQILLCRVILDVSVTAKPLQFESENISAGRDWFLINPDDFNRRCDEVRKGYVNFKGQELTLAKSGNAPYKCAFFPFYHPALPYGGRLPTVVVSGVQKSVLLANYEGGAALNWEVRASDTPYVDVHELIYNLGLPGLSNSGDDTFIELIGRAPVIISDASQIVNGVAVLELRAAANIASERVKLGYRIQRKDAVERSTFNAEEISWSSASDEVLLGSAQIPVGETPLLQAFVSYNNVALHQWWISDPTKHLNPRCAIHETIDHKLGLIADSLLNPGKESRHFEAAISVLLSILGFSVIHYGEIKALQDGPDIIAMTQVGNIAIVECTIGLIDQGDKLAKLVRRTKLVRDSLASSGYGHIIVQPVIITALPRDQVVAHLEEANRHKIAVVCREEIEGLFKQANLPPSSDRLFDEAMQAVQSPMPDKMANGS